MYTGTAKWAEAEAAAQEIRDDGPFSLMPNYKDNFAIANAVQLRIFSYPL
jgi:hypothetical protein